MAAALEAGITTAELFVAADMDDAAMVRVYARENATQRGQTSTALTGTVASAIRYLAKAILTGHGAGELTSSFHLPTLRDRLLSDDGMGRGIVLAFLHDIPGINDQSMKQQIANLKSSGDYARLIAEVQCEHGKKRGKKDQPSVDSTEDTQGQSRDVIAAAVGMGWDTYQKIGAVVEAKKCTSATLGLFSIQLMASMQYALGQDRRHEIGVCLRGVGRGHFRPKRAPYGRMNPGLNAPRQKFSIIRGNAHGAPRPAWVRCVIVM